MPYGLDAEQFEKHRHMMENPLDWPRWPVLPLKRFGDSTRPMAGVMVAIEARRLDVYFCNMFDLSSGLIGEQLDKYDKQTYKDFEAILDDGWRVD